MPKQIPKVGDVFFVKLSNGDNCIGQVIEIEPILMNSITCAFYDGKFKENVDPTEIVSNPKNVIACQFVTRDLFNKGIWKRIGNLAVCLNDELLPFRHTKVNNWIGATVRGSGIMNKFLNAFNGLGDWREMKDPEYYNKMLLNGKTPTVRT
jgi:hypothetical protein